MKMQRASGVSAGIELIRRLVGEWDRLARVWRVPSSWNHHSLDKMSQNRSKIATVPDYPYCRKAVSYPPATASDAPRPHPHPTHSDSRPRSPKRAVPTKMLP